jgi:hypothetical protein
MPTTFGRAGGRSSRTRNLRRFWRYLADAAEEARGLKRADVVMSIQENESNFFRKLLSHSRPVVTVGHTVDPNPLPLPVNSDLLFISFAYGGPNVEALMHFLKACLPGIRAVVPDGRRAGGGNHLRCFAPGPSGRQTSRPGGKRRERLPDAALVINPVRAGTGLKIKTIEALAFGRALVTTPCGADGLEAWEGNAFLVARDDSQFASTVVELLTNRAKLESLAASGPSFVKRWNEMQLEALQSILSIRDGQLR